MRTSPSVTPAAARASAEIRPCVVVAGCVMVVFTSPRLPVMDNDARGIDHAPRRLAAAFNIEGEYRPAGPSADASRAHAAGARRDGIVHPRDRPLAFEPARELERRGGLGAHSQIQSRAP